MGADRVSDPPDPGDAAVATVVGAVLVAAIAVAGLILYRTSFVPVQEERAEHRFSVAVAERLLELRTDLDDHLGRTEGGTLTTPIPVGQGPGGPLAPPRSPNTIAFDPAGRAAVHAPSARIVASNGTSLAQTEAEWTPFVGPPVQDITEVRDLWVRLDEIGARGGDSAQIIVNDADDDFAGRFRMKLEEVTGGGTGSPYVLRVRVENASGGPIFDQPVVMLRGGPVQDYRLRATDPTYAFDQVLEAVDGPVKLVFNQNQLSANHSMTWTETNRSSGAETVHPGGGPILSLQRGPASGAIRYEARSNNFVDQTFRIEHGAVLLRQGNTSALRIPPALEVGRVGDRAVVDLPMPALQGPATSTSGRSTIAVSTTPITTETVRAVARNASLNVTTDAPDAWVRFWNRSLAAALPDTAWQVESGPDWVNATVTGIDPNARDVDLHLRQATIRTIMER